MLFHSRSWKIAVAIGGLALVSCYASHERALEHGPVEHAEQFANDWYVMAAFGWALIETTTVYRFHDDGAIEVLDHTPGSYFEGEAGQWVVGAPGRDFDGPRCSFGARWWSEGDRLHVESDCTDGTERDLVLLPAGAGNTGPELGVVSPEGATGFWEFAERRGELRRCPGGC